MRYCYIPGSVSISFQISRSTSISVDQWFSNFSDHVPFMCPVLPSRTTLFQEKSMCQIPFDQKSGKPGLKQMQREQNGCKKF